MFLWWTIESWMLDVIFMSCVHWVCFSKHLWKFLNRIYCTMPIIFLFIVIFSRLVAGECAFDDWTRHRRPRPSPRGCVCQQTGNTPGGRKGSIWTNFLHCHSPDSEGPIRRELFGCLLCFSNAAFHIRTPYWRILNKFFAAGLFLCNISRHLITWFNDLWPVGTGHPKLWKIYLAESLGILAGIFSPG